MPLHPTRIGIVVLLLGINSCTTSLRQSAAVPAPLVYEEQEISTICDTVVQIIQAYNPPASTILSVTIAPASKQLLSQRLPVHLARVGFGLAGEGTTNPNALDAYVEISTIEEGVFLKVSMSERTVSTWLAKGPQGHIGIGEMWTLSEAQND